MPFRRLFHPHIHSRRYAHDGPRQGTFMGLRRTPPPKPGMMAYLVIQGLGIVLLIDLGIATVTQDKTTFRSICQAAGFWRDPPAFDQAHSANSDEQGG